MKGWKLGTHSVADLEGGGGLSPEIDDLMLVKLEIWDPN
jgi:hypothetical protein